MVVSADSHNYTMIRLWGIFCLVLSLSNAKFCNSLNCIQNFMDHRKMYLQALILRILSKLFILLCFLFYFSCVSRYGNNALQCTVQRRSFQTLQTVQFTCPIFFPSKSGNINHGPILFWESVPGCDLRISTHLMEF